MNLHWGESLTRLVERLKQEVQTFFRQEIHLVKTELGESLTQYRTDAIMIAAGGLVAWAGFLVLLCGLGALVAFALGNQGLNPLLAGCVGLGMVSLLAIIAGVAMLLFGVKALKREPVPGERTVRTLQRLPAPQTAKEKGAGQLASDQWPIISDQGRGARGEGQDRPKSAQAELNVVRTEERGAALIAALGEKMTLKQARTQAAEALRKHPYGWSLAAACGLAGVCALLHRQTRKNDLTTDGRG